jgi:hypothetical protein
MSENSITHHPDVPVGTPQVPLEEYGQHYFERYNYADCLS